MPLAPALRLAAFCALFGLGGGSACSRAPADAGHATGAPELHNDPQALAWRSRAKVPDADARQILAQTVSAARTRAAWAEAAHVHAADGPVGDGTPKFLFGEARLFLVEYETTPGNFRAVDAGDDASMALSDARFVFGLLARWAREHPVSWEVQLGALRGRIDAKGPDAAAARILDSLRQPGAADPPSDESSRTAIDRKYRDRRE
ncbi:MAG: hypothetical protein NVSMB23_09120 [Myxococcales bacterium]